MSFRLLVTSKLGFLHQQNVAAKMVRFIESKIALKCVVILLVPCSQETGMTTTTDLVQEKARLAVAGLFLLLSI